MKLLRDTTTIKMKFLAVVASMVSVIFARPEYYDGGHYTYQGPPAPIGHDGRVIDTPEVAHAKKAHLQAFADISAKIPYGGPGEDYEGDDYGQANVYSRPYVAGSYGYSAPTQFSNRVHHAGHGYQGPTAPLDHEGRVIDTPEVAHAKAAHFAAYSGNPRAYNAHAHIHNPPTPYAYGAAPAPVYHSYSAPTHGYGYQGPSAPLARDGRVLDTPEVAHAKAAHLAAFSKAAYGHAPYGAYGY